MTELERSHAHMVLSLAKDGNAIINDLTPETAHNLHMAVGIAGEAGELCNKIKKMMRDGLTKEELRDTIKGEISDCMWYVAALATEFNLSFSDILSFNLNKLYDRKERGVISGSGDNR